MAERAEVVARLAGIYAGRQAEMADLITAEMGAPSPSPSSRRHRSRSACCSTSAEPGKTFAVEDERPGMFGPGDRPA